MSAQLYLASRSPRRAEFLRQLGLRFETLPADVEEQPLPGQPPADYALATALAKAHAAARLAPLSLPVLGADTDVAIDGEILGKPRHRDDALAMLARLSGRTHEVCSAVAVVAGGRVETVLTVTRVSFGTIGSAAAEAYWASGEPADKAGAYAIQGYAARWVKRIEGSYSGVVGLPLYETCELLQRCGVELA
ncbi:MAG: Maf family protein [Nevskia sp.]|nr:Maf family protein [Nevskia sp.]